MHELLWDCEGHQRRRDPPTRTTSVSKTKRFKPFLKYHPTIHKTMHHSRKKHIADIRYQNLDLFNPRMQFAKYVFKTGPLQDGIVVEYDWKARIYTLMRLFHIGIRCISKLDLLAICCRTNGSKERIKLSHAFITISKHLFLTKQKSHRNSTHSS